MWKGESVCAVLNTCITESLNSAGLVLNWTSLQLNFDTLSRWHADDGVPGKVAILALGSFRCGQLQVESSGVVSDFDLKDRLLVFEACLRHKAHANSGRRWSVVAFQSAAGAAMDRPTSGRLKALGFGFGNPVAWVSPVGASWDLAA